ncbi:hypothetical protein CKJ90_32755 [Klebsiella pneumoniae]|nr:hypothetical protein CKJ90_32755 [Klebsiella pneumoniae]
MTAIRRGEISCIFTPAVYRRPLFFELTERRTGYALYGNDRDPQGGDFLHLYTGRLPPAAFL